jgi:hypothetical protein
MLTVWNFELISDSSDVEKNLCGLSKKVLKHDDDDDDDDDDIVILIKQQ